MDGLVVFNLLIVTILSVNAWHACVIVAFIILTGVSAFLRISTELSADNSLFRYSVDMVPVLLA